MLHLSSFFSSFAIFAKQESCAKATPDLVSCTSFPEACFTETKQVKTVKQKDENVLFSLSFELIIAVAREQD